MGPYFTLVLFLKCQNRGLSRSDNGRSTLYLASVTLSAVIQDVANLRTSYSAATHHNMLLDPAVLCNACSKEYLHYWAKSSIFVNAYATQFLNSVGCVPVDRESKDHLGLYQSTFDVMELNESIAVFPEGTSHTLSRISKLKDGASFVSAIHASIHAAVD